MAIRLNLLAEAQALEEQRRRDPVKRAIWGGVLVVLLILVWSSSLQMRAMLSRGELSRIEAQMASRTNEYRTALLNQSKLLESRARLAGLNQLATNRFLQGTALNALQQMIVDDVQLVRFRSEQSYLVTEETKPVKTDGKVIPGRPATSTERIVLTLDAKDISSIPGDQVAKFKHAISASPYFQTVMGQTNEVRLASLSPPQQASGGKAFVSFTLECRIPERTR
jgi:hypothetical protein